MDSTLIISLFDSIPLWVMLLPILISSIVLLAVFIERSVYFRSFRGDYQSYVERVAGKINEEGFDRNNEMIIKYNGPFSDLIESILDVWNGKTDKEFAIRHLIEEYIRKIEKFGGVVSTIATVAPMLGLLGTVTGMMKSFSSLSKLGPTAHDVLAQGITEALITTALGLVVAIPALIFYNYMVSKVNILIVDLEYIANLFLENKTKMGE